MGLGLLAPSPVCEAIMTTHENISTDYRGAKAGKFVTEEYAKHHPAATVKEPKHK